MTTSFTMSVVGKALIFVTAEFNIIINVALVTPGAWETLFTFARPCTLALGKNTINYYNGSLQVTKCGRADHTIAVPAPHAGKWRSWYGRYYDGNGYFCVKKIVRSCET